MNRSPDERILPPIAREVCQRVGAKVVVGGSVLEVGNNYLLRLNATNCHTGANIANEEIEALDKQQVLSKLGKALPSLRRKLGESISSIQRFDTPIEQATTKSLAALKAFTSGEEKRAQGQEGQSLPSYKLAIDLDPDFAMAYARLSAVSRSLNQIDLADEYMRKAFERREHVSDKEKFYIQARYYSDSAREPDNEIETYKLWAEIYPHDFLPFNGLASGYIEIGQLQKAIEAGQEALRVNPNHALPYASLTRAYERASRFPEAKAVCEKALAEKVDSFWTHQVLYRIAFVEGDGTAMQREVDWFKGKPQESVSTYNQAKAALSLGEVRRSRELFEHARLLAEARGLEEQALAMINGEAQFEADMGNSLQARTMAELALRTIPNSSRHEAFATLALARSGDLRRAETLVDQLSKQPLLGTGLNDVIFPCIRAALALDRKNPAAAITELERSGPYDLGSDSSGITSYYRGLAYLQLKSGKEAATQFETIVNNRGVVMVDIYWPLARLGLARAYVLQGDTPKALIAYKDFLTLWKDADPDIPILKQAKAEYAKLQ
jgi:tetratricopeptide (TPR) repeat protein